MNETTTRSTVEVREPPKTFLSSLKYLGPGFILSASIVGSGELIATTTLGAEAGFILLWVVLFGCMIKVAVQLEFGRYTITYGRPAFQAWNLNPGGRIYKWHWSIYITFVFLICTFWGQAGVLGGAAQVASYAVPSIPLILWLTIIALVISFCIFHGFYRPVEWIATGLNVLFVSVIIYCLYAIQHTPYAFSLADLGQGFTLQLPTEVSHIAFSAFGITGVASGEICMYSYWCLEKGYAAWTGPREDTDEWRERARGWIRVMRIDALVSMVVYTFTTCAFYLLGASILSQQETLKDGNEFIFQLSSLFTSILGPASRDFFMLGAFAVLFSTIFANTAGFSRLWTDFLGVVGIIDINNRQHHYRSIFVLAWIFPIICGFIYLMIQQPQWLIIFMGFFNALFLLVVAYHAVIFRYWYTDEKMRPTIFYDIVFIISVLSIAYMSWYTLYTKL